MNCSEIRLYSSVSKKELMAVSSFSVCRRGAEVGAAAPKAALLRARAQQVWAKGQRAGLEGRADVAVRAVKAGISAVRASHWSASTR